MMEQAHTCKRHNHAVPVAALYANVVADRAARLGNVANAASVRSFDVVVKREESVRTKRYALDRVKILPCFGICKRLGLSCKVLLPNAVRADVLLVLVDVAIYYIVAVGSAYCGLKGQVQNFFVLAQEPSVCLAACKPCAVDSRLLTSTNADSLTVVGEANRVGLGVFKGDERDYKVSYSFFPARRLCRIPACAPAGRGRSRGQF